MIYGIIGSRDFKDAEFTDYEYVSKVLSAYTDMSKAILGGGRGSEALALRYAIETELPYDIIKPEFDWKRGADAPAKDRNITSAFIVRNTCIIEASHALIVFWDGERSGLITSTLRIANTMRREIHILPMER